MPFRKLINFIQEIGTIMYVGGILSHIVIAAVLGHPDADTAYLVGVYKESSAYILILPGLALKIISDLVLVYQFDVKPNWLKIKLAMTAFLAINAFFFLVPMMPELVELANASMANGQVSVAYLEKAHVEELIGMSNAIPLLIEILMGSFKPKIGMERKLNSPLGLTS